MKRVLAILTALLPCALLLAGCTPQPEAGKRDSIPFSEGQLYAVAHLGYQHIEHLDYYAEHYLDSDALPIHYLSDGDYYLVIPRYDGMYLTLSQSDIETLGSVLIFEDPDCRPFIIQCNASDIFADAVIHLSYGEEETEFSPFISLKDGSIEVGPEGLLLTEPSD